MSNIYILEPPTKGKVLLRTSLGDLDIELWAKEAPLASRNFVQLCLEGYYDGTLFHRVVKGFIAQGGDPTGTGEGGQSIYDEPFKDEFHQRLRFVRRGLVAMANAGKNDNGSQFFFTLGPSPELNNKHTVFGKVTGDTIYNMLKFEEADIGPDDRPLYPHKIISTEVLSNPFPDIVPRTREPTTVAQKKEKKREKGVKNFKLLSFGDEAEEDEGEVEVANKEFVSKNKAAPDLVEAEADEPENPPNKTPLEPPPAKKAKTTPNEAASAVNVNSLISSYRQQHDKYAQLKTRIPRKGESRESDTLEMLKNFRSRIHKVKTGDAGADGWLGHELKCDSPLAAAKDANTKADDWFDITDPRNELNKRKRLEKKKTREQNL